MALPLERSPSGKSFGGIQYVRDFAGLLIRDGQSSSQVQGHRTLYTSENRLKMVHKDPNQVKLSWTHSSQSSVKLGSDMPPHAVLVSSRLTAPAPDEGQIHKEVADGACLIEFDTFEVLWLEKDKEPPQVNIRREGNLAGKVACDWIVKNGTIDSKVFNLQEELEGRAIFEDGQELIKCVLPSFNDPSWNCDAFYVVEIAAVERLDGSVEKVHVGRTKRLHVYALNSDAFPANVPHDATLSTLMRGFLWHCFSDLPRKSTAGLVLGFVAAALYYLNAKLGEALVNCVSNEPPDCQYLFFKLGRDPIYTMICYAGFTLVLLFMSFLQERFYRRLRLGGKAKRKLRANLFATMLNLSQESLNLFDSGDLPKMLDTDAETAISDVWLRAFDLFTVCWKLAFKCLITTRVAVHSTTLLSALILAGAPVLMLAIMAVEICISTKKDFEHMTKIRATEENWFAFVSMSEICRPLINLYRQAAETTVTADQAHGRINQATIQLDDHKAMTGWFVQLGMCLMYVCAAGVLGEMVKRHDLPVGSFTLVSATLLDLGTTLSAASDHIEKLFAGSAVVKQLARVMNLETSQMQRLKRIRPESNTHRLILDNVSYSYAAGETAEQVQALIPLSVELAFDKLICIRRCQTTASNAASKLGFDTLFRIMAKQLIPSCGSVSMPARWRSVYVPLIPMLFDGTLMYNLSYGVLGMTTLPEEIEEAVWNACRAIGMSDSLIGKADFDVGTMGERLKMSDRLCVSLVRALIFDAELILVSSVIDVLGESRGRQVLQFLKDYISNRGLRGPHDALPREFRPHKCVVYTTKIPGLQEEICDDWFEFGTSEDQVSF
eukprot:TRINITY_DN76243_c0_g1_i1.p1 TRINITY_DN76243_c0_g1~~TRINITY_DN76243_c0_g1_i1.p1  ORF type:complete len:835 (-),score=112.60 TRINITY_DN76243_c0_g1_i1:16-2520(-)